MEIKGKTLIISGAASGIGAATAAYFAKLGAKVILLDINEEALQITATQTGGIAIACDVTKAEQVEQAMQAASKAHGPIRICISCAGIAPARRIVGREGLMPLADFDKVIAINLVGTFNLIRCAAAQMMQYSTVNETAERGVVIMTASIAAFEGQIGQAAYSASKGGVVAMTLPAAREFAQFGIRVNTIAPGLIATPLLLSMPTEVQQSLAASVPYPKRLGRPEEFAKLAAHIVDNEMINGEVIRLDGAIRMQPR